MSVTNRSPATPKKRLRITYDNLSLDQNEISNYGVKNFGIHGNKPIYHSDLRQCDIIAPNDMEMNCNFPKKQHLLTESCVLTQSMLSQSTNWNGREKNKFTVNSPTKLNSSKLLQSSTREELTQEKYTNKNNLKQSKFYANGVTVINGFEHIIPINKMGDPTILTMNPIPSIAEQRDSERARRREIDLAKKTVRQITHTRMIYERKRMNNTNCNIANNKTLTLDDPPTSLSNNQLTKKQNEEISNIYNEDENKRYKELMRLLQSDETKYLQLSRPASACISAVGKPTIEAKNVKPIAKRAVSREKSVVRSASAAGSRSSLKSEKQTYNEELAYFDDKDEFNMFTSVDIKSLRPISAIGTGIDFTVSNSTNGIKRIGIKNNTDKLAQPLLSGRNIGNGLCRIYSASTYYSTSNNDNNNDRTNNSNKFRNGSKINTDDANSIFFNKIHKEIPFSAPVSLELNQAHINKNNRTGNDGQMLLQAVTHNSIENREYLIKQFFGSKDDSKITIRPSTAGVTLSRPNSSAIFRKIPENDLKINNQHSAFLSVDPNFIRPNSYQTIRRNETENNYYDNEIINLSKIQAYNKLSNSKRPSTASEIPHKKILDEYNSMKNTVTTKSSSYINQFENINNNTNNVDSEKNLSFSINIDDLSFDNDQLENIDKKCIYNNMNQNVVNTNFRYESIDSQCIYSPILKDNNNFGQNKCTDSALLKMYIDADILKRQEQVKNIIDKTTESNNKILINNRVPKTNKEIALMRMRKLKEQNEAKELNLYGFRE